MRALALALLSLALLAFLPMNLQAQESPLYFPPAGDVWETRTPEALGMSSSLLERAVSYARENETRYLKDLAEQLRVQYAADPFNEVVGPTKERGGPNGLVLRRGYIVAEWGDTRRADMTFSISKSFLSAIAGLAYDRRLIPDLDEPVRDSVHDGGFDSPHNSSITWKMLLQQTSEWEGTLFGKPDMADRRTGRDRELQKPGTYWEYNDIRVNRTALSLLRLFKRPLPEVMKESIMDPIGASESWEYHGYSTSEVLVDGVPMVSVSGGGHYGGGLWAASRDLARFGLLFLNRGTWADRKILSPDWVDMSLEPCALNPQYGYMWWLNTDRKRWSRATPRTFAAIGSGTSAIVVSPERELVIVVRWIDDVRLNEFIGRVFMAVTR